MELKIKLLEEKEKYNELNSKYQVLKIRIAKLEAELAEKVKEIEKMYEQKVKNNQVSILIYINITIIKPYLVHFS